MKVFRHIFTLFLFHYYYFSKVLKLIKVLKFITEVYLITSNKIFYSLQIMMYWHRYKNNPFVEKASSVSGKNYYKATYFIVKDFMGIWRRRLVGNSFRFSDSSYKNNTKYHVKKVNIFIVFSNFLKFIKFINLIRGYKIRKSS